MIPRLSLICPRRSICPSSIIKDNWNYRKEYRQRIKVMQMGLQHSLKPQNIWKWLEARDKWRSFSHPKRQLHPQFPNLMLPKRNQPVESPKLKKPRLSQRSETESSKPSPVALIRTKSTTLKVCATTATTSSEERQCQRSASTLTGCATQKECARTVTSTTTIKANVKRYSAAITNHAIENILLTFMIESSMQ